MASDPLLKINGTDWTGRVLSPFKFGRPKLWAEDTGRVMSGDMQGTLIGIFPKLTALFYPESVSEMKNLCTALDAPSQNLQVFNPKTGKLMNLGTYTSDYEVNIINFFGFDDYEVEPIQVSFIAMKKE